MARRSATVIPAGAIGPLLGTIVASPTSCTSAVAASTQAQTTTASTAGGWCVASLAPNLDLFAN